MPIPDAGERQRALDPSQSYLVQAPAGSGKTELLIQRYLALLPRVEHPESVLAITFTKKAAGEMRRRVLQALEAAGGPAPEAPHQALTWELARAVRARDASARWALLNNPHRLNIRTIDSLCVSLTRQMPWLSRFGAPAGIQEDAVELYREAARRTVAMVEDERWFSSMSRLLLHLDNNVPALEGLFASMLERRDQWLRLIGVGGDRNEQRSVLEAALRDVVSGALARARDAVPAEFRGELAALAAFAAANLNDPAAPLSVCVGLSGLPAAEPDALSAWLGIGDLLFTKSGDWRSRVDARCGFPRDARAAKDRWTTLAGALRRHEEVRSELLALRSLPPERFGDEQWQVVDALLTVLPTAVAQLRLVFRERGVTDFSEVTQAALRALGEIGNPTDLALALDYRLEHVLIDEFQDTSLSQFQLLERLTQGWQPGDGRTLFAVGDPMQSIYRFREAEVGLFLNARRLGVGALRPEPLCLTANFRSEAGVVRWVNDTFAQVFPAAEDVATGAIRFSESIPANDSGPDAVRIHAFSNRNDAGEAARVTEIVLEERRRSPRATIAVLARARSHLTAILEQLRAAGLRYRAVDIEALAEVPVIGDLIAVTRALLHPADRVSWLAILRAPWCGLTLADLHALVGDAPQTAVWDLLRDAGRAARLSVDGQARLAGLREVLERAFSSRQETLRAWIEGVWLALGGPACVRNQAEIDSAGAFFDLLEELDEGRDADLERLQARIETLFAKPDPEGEETLQVMSIHKAKGLEFDVVILPGLGRRTRPDDPVLLRWLERPSESSSGELLLAPIPAAGTTEDPLSRYVKSIENRKDDYEFARLLYVAATRARRQLHLLGHATCRQDSGQEVTHRPEAGSLLHRLWPAVEVEFARRAVPPATALAAAVPAALVLRRLESEWSLPAPPTGVRERIPSLEERAAEPATGPTYAWVGETLRHIGVVTHQMLNQMAGGGPSARTPDAVRARRSGIEAMLRALGLARTEATEAAGRVERALLETLDDPRGAWIFDPAHTEERSEAPLTGEINGQIISAVIDRTFIDADGTRWIIDFKTSSHEGGDSEAFLDRERERYRGQLKSYRELFARLEQRPIRLGLYFPLLRGWREYTETGKAAG